MPRTQLNQEKSSVKNHIFPVFRYHIDLSFIIKYYYICYIIILWGYIMNRISITVEPAVYHLLKTKVNRSKYVSELVLQDAYEAKKDVLVERTKRALLKDKEFVGGFRAFGGGSHPAYDVHAWLR